MTPQTSPVWRVSRIISRIGVAVAVVCFVAGLAMRSPSGRIWLGVGVLALGSIPAASVFVLLADYVRKRDWRFVIAALIVAAILAYNIGRTIG